MPVADHSSTCADALSELGASSTIQTRIGALAKYSEILHDGTAMIFDYTTRLCSPGLVDCGNGELLWLAVRDLTSSSNPHAVGGVLTLQH